MSFPGVSLHGYEISANPVIPIFRAVSVLNHSFRNNAVSFTVFMSLLNYIFGGITTTLNIM